MKNLVNVIAVLSVVSVYLAALLIFAFSLFGAAAAHCSEGIEQVIVCPGNGEPCQNMTVITDNDEKEEQNK